MRGRAQRPRERFPEEQLTGPARSVLCNRDRPHCLRVRLHQRRFHEGSANAIETIVGTRVLSPFAAVVWAATFNFAAVFIGSTAVAKAVSSGFVEQSVVTPNVICAALLGAIVWNLITWLFGIPSSSSHAIIGGFSGAAVAKAGFSVLIWGTKFKQTLAFIVISPVLGMAIRILF